MGQRAERTVVGRYEILVELARGGMGSVSVGRIIGAHGVQRLVAIKRLTGFEKEREAARLFLAEAWLSAKIHHPNVVQTLDLFEHDGAPHLVMDLVEGVSLNELLRVRHARGLALDADLVAWIGAQVAAGLHAAHELTDDDRKPLDIVHRDVSPQNVLLSFDGRAYVADFGIAKFAHRDVATESGVVRGKAAYMSPEQTRAQPLDRRSDIFSLGVVLHEALAGERLFARDTPAATILAVLEDAPPALGAGPRRIPAELANIVARCLGKERSARYATAAEVRDALGGFLRARGTHVDETDVAKLLDAELPGRRAELAERIRAASAAGTATAGEMRARADDAPPRGEGDTHLTASMPLERDRSRALARVAMAAIAAALATGAFFGWRARGAAPRGETDEASATRAPIASATDAADRAAPDETRAAGEMRGAGETRAAGEARGAGETRAAGEARGAKPAASDAGSTLIASPARSARPRTARPAASAAPAKSAAPAASAAAHTSAQGVPFDEL